jgi:hypothetical protein
LGTESAPPAPTPIRLTAVVGRVASLLTTIAMAESAGASGVKVTVSVCDAPGARLNEPGVTEKTDVREGGAISICTLPARLPFPEFLMVKFLLLDWPMPVVPRFSEAGKVIFAPDTTGVGVGMGVWPAVAVGVEVDIAVEVAVPVDAGVAVSVADGIAVGVAGVVAILVGVGVIGVVALAVGVGVAPGDPLTSNTACAIITGLLAAVALAR